MNQEELKNTKGPLVYVATRDDGMRYIGVTKRTINRRYSTRDSVTHFSTAYHHSPDRFTFDIIPCDSEADAYDLEELMVNQDVVDSEMYFNHRVGGSEGYTISEESKAKMSEASMGKVLSQETKTKLVAVRRPQGYPDLLSPSGVIHQVVNIKQFAKDHDLRQGNLSHVVNENREEHRGWRLAHPTKTWERQPQSEEAHKAFLKSRRPEGYPPVMSPEGVIHTFDCLKHFAVSQGLIPHCLSAVINGTRKSNKGWRLAPSTN